jgi:hypothetical protein
MVKFHQRKAGGYQWLTWCEASLPRFRRIRFLMKNLVESSIGSYQCKEEEKTESRDATGPYMTSALCQPRRDRINVRPHVG